MRRFLEYFNSPKKTKLILSLDGGGVRAIAEVVFLKQLEIASGRKIFDLFSQDTSANSFPSNINYFYIIAKYIFEKV